MYRSIFIVPLILMLGLSAQAENWTFFGGSKYAELYVDLDTVTRSEDSFTVWVKYVFTPDGRARFRKDNNIDVSYSKELLEITQTKKHRSHVLLLYNEANLLLYERKHAKPWAPVEAGKHLEPLWKFLYQEQDPKQGQTSGI